VNVAVVNAAGAVVSAAPANVAAEVTSHELC
jgi:hypothetical protein